MKRNLHLLYTIIGLVPIMFIIIGFLLIPFSYMFIDSFHAGGTGRLTFENYVFTNSFYLVAMKNSLLISLLSSVIGIIAALFISYGITRFADKTRNVLIIITNMTANFSGVPLAFSYIVMFGYSGVITTMLNQVGFNNFDLYSWSGIVLLYVFFQIPIGVLFLFPLFNGIREDWVKASSILGASSFSFWRYIGLPVILPGIIGTFSILFANAMGSQATAYALVGGNYNLLTIRISSLISGDITLQPEMGSTLSIVLSLLMIITVWLNQLLLKRVRRDI